MYTTQIDQNLIIKSFYTLSAYISDEGNKIKSTVEKACVHNAWFTQESVRFALKALAESMKEENVKHWLSLYPELNLSTAVPKRVALVMAGNIPAVGFHDIICVLASGNIALLKLSSQDTILIPFLLEELSRIEPAFKSHYQILERLEGFDAVIATGSNNSSRYFDYYFGRYPNIIRKNRNSVAVLKGTETAEELQLLGQDIFMYFGLGCRNVAKLYVPEGYSFNPFFEAIEPWSRLLDMHKYAHNYDYQLTLKLLSQTVHYSNGFFILVENESLHSAISVLHYETYTSIDQLKALLLEKADAIQCTVSIINELSGRLDLGSTQQPQLWDYADNIDTMKFLLAQ